MCIPLKGNKIASKGSNFFPLEEKLFQKADKIILTKLPPLKLYKVMESGQDNTEPRNLEDYITHDLDLGLMAECTGLSVPFFC